MAQRRGFGTGAAEGASDMIDMIMRNQMETERANQGAVRNDQLERGRQADTLIASGKLKPEDRAAFISGTYTGPTTEDRVASISSGLTKAPTPQEVAGPRALADQLRSVLPTRRPSPLDPNTDPTLGFGTTAINQGEDGTLPSRAMGTTNSPEMSNLLATRDEKLASFPGIKTEYYEPGTGAKRNKFISPTQTTGVDLQAEPTPAQAGANKQTELLNGELSPPVISARAKQAGAEAGARTNADLSAQIAHSGLTQQQQQAALALSDNFTQESRDFFQQQDNFRRMAQTYARLKTNPNLTGAGDLAMVFSFMKVLDPTSVVREGEQASATNAGGVPEWLRAKYNQLTSGGRLSPAERVDFMQQASTMYTGAARDHKERVDRYSQRAQGMGVPPQFVVRDSAPDLGSTAEDAGLSELERLRRTRTGAGAGTGTGRGAGTGAVPPK